MVENEMTPTPEKAEKKPLLQLINDVFDVVELFVICASVILALFTFIARPTIVEGESMENTLLGGDALQPAERCTYMALR